jgi:uncharacterized protein YbaP (TraB family)
MIRRSLLPLALLVPCLGACADDPSLGYSTSSTYDTGVRTVAVPIFENETFEYRLEAMLTEAIIKEIQQTTPWRVVSAGNADTTLIGTLTDADIRKTATKAGVGYAQEQSVELVVDFDWKDNRTGQTLVSRRQFAAAEIFAASLPVQERIEIGQHAAIQRLARDIVHELRSNW